MNKITLPKGYHNFADKRTMNGLPNSLNVKILMLIRKKTSTISKSLREGY